MPPAAYSCQPFQGSSAARKTPAEKENPIVAKTRIVLSPPPVIVSFYYTKYSCL